jgi:hypothetical protein
MNRLVDGSPRRSAATTYDPAAAMRGSSYLHQAPRSVAAVYRERLVANQRDHATLVWLHGIARRLGVA